MGIFRTDVCVENPMRPCVLRVIRNAMVDTGSEHTWIPRAELEALGLTPLRSVTFVSADGREITRDVCFGNIYVEDTSAPEILVFAEPGDMTLLGARGLEGLNLRVDVTTKRLLPAGPVPVAVAAPRQLAHLPPLVEPVRQHLVRLGQARRSQCGLRGQKRAPRRGALELNVAPGQGASFQFGTAVAVAQLNSAAVDQRPAFSIDGREVYFTSARDGTPDIWVSRRQTLHSPWEPPSKLGVINTGAQELHPSLSADGMTLYFASNRAGNPDLYVARRIRVR